MRRICLLVLLCLPALAAEGIPRPEYPQPQFQREQWLNLNGRWEFAFDDGNRGLEENWAAGAKKFERAITVPFCFESQLSGIGDTSFHPWVWYRRAITLPEAWKGRRPGRAQPACEIGSSAVSCSLVRPKRRSRRR